MVGNAYFQIRSTKDFGKSWDLVAEMANSRFYWAETGMDPDPSTVHAEIQDPLSGLYFGVRIISRISSQYYLTKFIAVTCIYNAFITEYLFLGRYKYKRFVEPYPKESPVDTNLEFIGIDSLFVKSGYIFVQVSFRFVAWCQCCLTIAENYQL